MSKFDALKNIDSKMSETEKKWYEEVNESRPPTELIDMETAEQEELYHLGEDAYNKSYERLVKSKKIRR